MPQCVIMIEINKQTDHMNIYFYLLLLATASLTIYTDFREKRIKNIHLFVISSAAIVLYSLLLISGKLTLSSALILNPMVSLIIGFILYASGLWKAGDAKLFFTYSLLLPVNKYPAILPWGCLVLFINTFLISFLCILPLSVRDILRNKNMITQGSYWKKGLITFGKTLFVVFCISWLSQPILHFLPFKSNIFLTFILLYVGYSLFHKFIIRSKFGHIIIPLFIVIGFIIRYFFLPESLKLEKITASLKSLFIYSLAFYILGAIVDTETKESQRIPFAPFMFIGALLSNTNFLWWVLKTLAYLR